jgi:hypothetical protein
VKTDLWKERGIIGLLDSFYVQKRHKLEERRRREEDSESNATRKKRNKNPKLEYEIQLETKIA